MSDESQKNKNSNPLGLGIALGVAFGSMFGRKKNKVAHDPLCLYKLI
jgi:hypothetical protein